jgi:hypothetical protein
MKLMLVAPLLMQLGGPESGPTAAQLEAACKVALCREETTIHLKVAHGGPLIFSTTGRTPIVMDNVISIVPGETVRIEATRQQEGLTRLRAVASVVHPERTLVFSFRQEPSIGDGTGMVLTANSPFAGVLKYDLGMTPPDGGDVVGTSSCPVRRGVPVFEHWPHPVLQLLVANLRFLKPGSKDTNRCE